MDEKDALKISREVAKNVRKAISSISIEERNKTVGMGKDGTPTKLIDKIAERAAFEVLNKEDVTIISEEAGIVGEGDVHVALDPLDGTFNATRDVPIYSISLCFSMSKYLKDVFFGYVYNLATSTEYYADSFAYRNGKRVKVSDESSLFCNAIVYYPWSKFPFKRMRVFGSAALELCFVSDGSFDCFIDIRGDKKGMLRVYDVAAGIYIAKKAGAVVSDEEGRTLNSKKFDMDERFKIVAANKELHPKLLELIP